MALLVFNCCISSEPSSMRPLVALQVLLFTFSCNDAKNCFNRSTCVPIAAKSERKGIEDLGDVDMKVPDNASCGSGDVFRCNLQMSIHERRVRNKRLDRKSTR